MSGGGKKGGAEVYDFLMSIDYGICHGPLNSINQVWVKDKPIWCGKVQERTDLSINLPELFGGDDAEGGVRGTVEVYMGDSDQVASAQLSARFGLTPEQMPGYRGLAHLFFRGNNLVTVDDIPDPEAEPDPDEEIGAGGLGLLSGLSGLGGAAPNANGFQWTTNNPYLPVSKVHVCDFPQALSESWSYIYPFAEYDEEGNPLPYENWLFTADEIGGSYDFDNGSGNKLTFALSPTTLAALGGEVRLITTHSAQAETNGSNTPVSANIWSVARFKDGSGTTLATHSTGSDSGSPAAYTSSIVRDIPEGTTSVEFEHFGALVFPIGQHWGARSFSASLAPVTASGGGAVGATGHCDVDGEGLRLFPNANPAHAIYETMVNAEWGKGEDPSNIDAESFLAAAEVLHGELFGLSMIWVAQTEIEKFQQEILDHIQAFLFQHPATGLWTLKLLRADYDAEAAPLLDPSNAKLKNRKRRAWGETINEIVVEWTDPLSEESATVVAHDLANIAVQGGVNSETRNYYGVRDEWLAQFIADRDVRESSHPIFTTEAWVDRSRWNIVPGDVVRVSWPRDGIEELVCRVMEVDYGKPKDRRIKLSLSEDIFAVDRTAYGTPQNSSWASGRAEPAPLDAEMAVTVPLPLVLRGGVDVAEVDAEWPAASPMFFGTGGSATIDFQVHGDVTKANGDTAVERLMTAPTTASVQIGARVPNEAETWLSGALVQFLLQEDADVGDMLVFGSSEADHEIVMLDSYDSANDRWVAARGIWDTVPREWPQGTRLWALPSGTSRVDTTTRAAGDTITYRLLPRTAEGVLPYDDADDFDYLATERVYLPFRPADTELDASGFDTLEYHDTVPSTITATWANRNRTLEDTVAAKWAGGNVTGEAGQTTTLRVYDTADNLVVEYADLTGTSHAITVADLGAVDQGYVEFIAETSAGESLWNARRAFDLRTYGYGMAWGEDYGSPS